MRDKPEHLTELDGIRALAIIPVLLIHGAYGRPQGGFLGVDLFFVLSGFLITKLLLEEYERNQSIDLPNFYARRALRILPPVAVGLLLAWTLGKFNPATGVQPILLFYANYVDFTLLTTMTHMWSLSVEEQFYLVWPLILSLSLRFGSRRIALWIAASIFLSAVVFRIWCLTHNYPIEVVYRHTLARSDALAAGSMAAMWGARQNSQATRIILPVALLGYVVSVIFVNRTSNTLLSGGLSVFAIAAAVSIKCLVAAPVDGSVKVVLSSRVLGYIGSRSYGIYVYHLPIFIFLEMIRVPHSPSNFLLVLVLKFAITFAVAEVSYKLIEQPILRLKRVLYPSETQTKAQALPYRASGQV